MMATTSLTYPENRRGMIEPLAYIHAAARSLVEHPSLRVEPTGNSRYLETLSELLLMYRTSPRLETRTEYEAFVIQAHVLDSCLRGDGPTALSRLLRRSTTWVISERERAARRLKYHQAHPEVRTAWFRALESVPLLSPLLMIDWSRGFVAAKRQFGTQQK